MKVILVWFIGLVMVLFCIVGVFVMGVVLIVVLFSVVLICVVLGVVCVSGIVLIGLSVCIIVWLCVCRLISGMFSLCVIVCMMLVYGVRLLINMFWVNCWWVNGVSSIGCVFVVWILCMYWCRLFGNLCCRLVEWFGLFGWLLWLNCISI